MFIGSAVDISHPRQQRISRQATPTVGGLVCCVNVIGLSDGASAVNIVAPTPADEAVVGGDKGGCKLCDVGSHILASSSVAAQDS